MAPLTMEALQFDRKSLTLKHTKVAVPTGVDKNEIIIRIAYAGICGTDLQIIAVSPKDPIFVWLPKEGPCECGG